MKAKQIRIEYKSGEIDSFSNIVSIRKSTDGTYYLFDVLVKKRSGIEKQVVKILDSRLIKNIKVLGGA